MTHFEMNNAEHHTVWTKNVLKFLASGRNSGDHGISPLSTLFTGST